MTEAEKRRRLVPKGGQFLYHNMPDGTRLRYGIWQSKAVSKRGSMIILPGASEFIEKYFEVINELLERDFSVIILDWRGQGLSTRPLNNPQKHHYDSFDSLVEDLDSFINMLCEKSLPQPFNILAHSMGGHIALRYLHDHPGLVKSAMLTAPMVDVYYAGLPVWFVKALNGFMGLIGKSTSYAPMQGDFNYEEGGNYKKEWLTSDQDRFDDEYYQLQQNPDLTIGGKTYGWLSAAMRSINILNAEGYGEGITTPVSVVQAECDKLVRNDRQKALVDRIPSANFHVIKGAQHEILKEHDMYRAQFWQIFDDTYEIK